MAERVLQHCGFDTNMSRAEVIRALTDAADPRTRAEGALRTVYADLLVPGARPLLP
jgi:hypothetical protein